MTSLTQQPKENQMNTTLEAIRSNGDVLTVAEQLCNIIGWMQKAYDDKRAAATERWMQKQRDELANTQVEREVKEHFGFPDYESLMYHVFASMVAEDWESNLNRGDYVTMALEGVPKMDLQGVFDFIKQVYCSFEESDRDYTIVLAFLDRVNEQLELT